MRLFSFLITLSVVFLLQNCVSETAVQEHNRQIAFAGKVENASVEKMRFFKQISPVEWRLHAEIPLDKQGNFHLHFEDTLAQYYKLSCGKVEWNLFLSPKDSLYMTFDEKTPFKTIRNKGKRGKHENNYLNSKAFFIQKHFVDSIFQMNEKDFHKEIKYIKKQFLFAINEANIQQKGFRMKERNAIDYMMGKLLYLYPKINKDISSGTIKLSDHYYEFMDALAVENTQFIDIPEYLDFMSNLILYEYSEMDPKPMIEEVILKYFKEPANIQKVKKILI
ncbi:MAG: hypothetical protein N4A45_04035 [Flavobacteriales bacterium]|jgi:hypothetical protein|nr:hypothetical protein [Flavobacteriales bacterium]